MSIKESGKLSEVEYFFAMACLSARRSKDPNSKVGACIVNPKKKIIGLGYNGMPNGCSDDELPWSRIGDKLNTKYPYVCHAEMNAILNMHGENAEDSTAYVTLFPCNECAKLIIQSGIRKVLYLVDKYAFTPEVMAAKRLFDLAEVNYKQYEPSRKTIRFNFQPDSPLETLSPNVVREDEGQRPISWSVYFMSVACLAASMSSAQNCQVGVCFVNNRNRIVGIDCNEKSSAPTNENEDKLESHQECSAVISALNNQKISSYVPQTMYITEFPCSECAKVIASSGIVEIIYLSSDLSVNDEYMSAQHVLDVAEVKYRKFELPENPLVLTIC